VFFPLGYQGAFSDPDTGLINAHARWYNPALGTFASRDTLALPVDPTPQTNRYQYANASPLLILDPTGHWPEWLDNAWNKVTEYTNWWWSSFQAGLHGEEPTVEAPAWVQSVNNWTDEHKDVIAEVAVGAVAFVGCEAALGVVTAGVGAVAGGAACGAFAGDVGGVVGQAVRCAEHKTDDACTHDAFAEAAGKGVLTGLVGGAIGGMFGGALTSQAGSALQRTLTGAIGGGAAGAAGGAATGGILGAIGYAGNCQDSCSWDGLVDAASDEAQHGAVLGAIFGALGGAFGAAGRSCPHSFAPDTPVLLADGTTKPIKEVAVADRVAATDPQTGLTTAKPVTQLHTNRDTELTDVTIVTTLAAGATTATLHTTQHHPFWDNTASTWVDAKDLVVGHELRSSDGNVQFVAEVHNFAGAEYMRDLTVADFHTYYVVSGNTSVLVHNCGTQPFGGKPCACGSPTQGSGMHTASPTRRDFPRIHTRR
jgi:RHS repeat-associated protein